MQTWMTSFFKIKFPRDLLFICRVFYVEIFPHDLPDQSLAKNSCIMGIGYVFSLSGCLVDATVKAIINLDFVANESQ